MITLYALAGWLVDSGTNGCMAMTLTACVCGWGFGFFIQILICLGLGWWRKKLIQILITLFSLSLKSQARNVPIPIRPRVSTQPDQAVNSYFSVFFHFKFICILVLVSRPLRLVWLMAKPFDLLWLSMNKLKKWNGKTTKQGRMG